ncbi:hypothetical protein KFL_002900140 [Klebsormidium nitens]|uniref:Glycosyltransferase 61 catalytic domain-containing protein n=1 Tax=Klebsormidium nitens TaxID=105231 RepID=A0A1Y1IBI7_KLENI|nr:hypothetical protein KFL_002900140 [Klebsormidium nitens]|eukprot:GAQ86461.1 hypothetical protein KFL_002900140 [Klebsormidium nitens]
MDRVPRVYNQTFWIFLVAALGLAIPLGLASLRSNDSAGGVYIDLLFDSTISGKQKSEHALRWGLLQLDNRSAACETLPWNTPGYGPTDREGLQCDNEEHCSFVFSNACFSRNQSATGYVQDKWLVEVASDCHIPNPPTKGCQLESGSAGNRIKILSAEEGVVPGKEGFDKMPTILLDRSRTKNLFEDSAMDIYPLFQNMRLRGWGNCSGRRIAIIDKFDMPSLTERGLPELYYAFKQSETADWRHFSDRKCFQELTLMRTSYKWGCGSHTTATYNPSVTEYGDFIAAHFGLPQQHPRLPERPTLVYLKREANRRINNWAQLARALHIPYTIHSATMSWSEQISAVRNASIVFGTHGAGFALLPHAPIGAVVIEVYNDKQRDRGLYHTVATVSGLSYLKYTVDDHSAIHKVPVEGIPADSLFMYHFADVDLPEKTFQGLDGDLARSIFFDRFVEKKPRAVKAAGSVEGASLIQPLQKGHAARSHLLGGGDASAAVEESRLTANDAFFYNVYAAKAAKKPGRKQGKGGNSSDEDSDAGAPSATKAKKERSGGRRQGTRATRILRTRIVIVTMTLCERC